ncbi:inositol monophosphatase family protein [Lactobacillus sp. DCY120]|uniref:Inositol monophosphatase family protein n=1 Tax=Bombilactobacillus apium TaxID=2675299 RepID=A0A850R4E3_9LACO|nr:inositol monophosphatase family protein [Bombilactobacillus apium]NVY95707.1 inositol monophosphatase family protein [Bombilactobacillus apium]
MMDLEFIQNQVLMILTRVKNQLRQDPSFETVQTKSNRNDLVTNRDQGIERQIVDFLREKFPTARIISEESWHQQVNDSRGLIFLVDPIDGTMNFVKCRDQFASMIGVYVNGIPLFGAIVDVMQNQVYYGGPQMGAFCDQQPLAGLPDPSLAQSLVTIGQHLLIDPQAPYWPLIRQSSGLRVYGSAGIVWTRLLQGKQQIYISQLQPWDLAAGRAIAAALGIVVRAIDAHPLNMLKSQLVIIGTKCATTEALKVISRAQEL